ncbi:MAG: hypothetical protein NTW36_03705 [Planctomycetia bacterium]|jgi:hypothetical protein|nr:hypothetical protein [Planctomycetia bacterium]
MENLVNELICRTVKQLRTHTSARHGRIDPPDLFPGREEMNHSGGPPGRDGEKKIAIRFNSRIAGRNHYRQTR